VHNCKGAHDITVLANTRAQASSAAGAFKACTHVRLGKDLIVLLDPKRQRLVYVVLADGAEKDKLKKVACRVVGSVNKQEEIENQCIRS
jgi:hypothetical protein